MGVVGNGIGTTQYSSGPWANDINLQVQGKKNHRVGDIFPITTSITQKQPPPIQAWAFAPGGTSGVNLGIGVYGWCVIDDH